MKLGDYTWLIVVGAFGAFLFGYGTGSNDVANAFGTSVGAKTLTLKQAVMIATVFEFTGAMVLSRVSTSVIAGGIADIKAFQREPIFYAYGMVCALAVAGTWQVVSSYFSFNTSSTHSIIGCIIGFALIYGGPSAVLWYQPDPNSFPPVKGVTPIVVSWFFSPIFCAIASAFFFTVLKYSILRRPWGFHASFYIFPLLVLVTFFLCLYFVFTKGAKKTFQNDADDWTDAKSAWISACAAGGCALIAAAFMPWVSGIAHRRFEGEDQMREELEAAAAKAGKEADLEEPFAPAAGKDSASNLLLKNKEDPTAAEAERAIKTQTGKTEGGKQSSESSTPHSSMKSRAISNFWLVSSYITHGVDVDIHQCVDDDPIVAKIHRHAEKFSPKVEYVFSYLQVFSACCVIFAHGAGEVGYMSGPLGAIVDIVHTGAIHKTVAPELWVIAICAVGLVLGLATYGYNVVRAVGVRLAKLSPTRGFCAELSTAFVIMIASQYGLPTSSSQVITGGIVGIGLCEGVLGVNWGFFGIQFASWVGTMFVCGVGTAALFAAGVYAPCLQMAKTIIGYEDKLGSMTIRILNSLLSTLDRFNQSANEGLIQRMTLMDLMRMRANLTRILASEKLELGPIVQTPNPATLFANLISALSFVQSDSVLTIGQDQFYPGSMMCFNGSSYDAVCTTPTLV